jgi:hypothetical protein
MVKVQKYNSFNIMLCKSFYECGRSTWSSADKSALSGNL